MKKLIFFISLIFFIGGMFLLFNKQQITLDKDLNIDKSTKIIGKGNHNINIQSNYEINITLEDTEFNTINISNTPLVTINLLRENKIKNIISNSPIILRGNILKIEADKNIEIDNDLTNYAKLYINNYGIISKNKIIINNDLNISSKTLGIRSNNLEINKGNIRIEALEESILVDNEFLINGGNILCMGSKTLNIPSSDSKQKSLLFNNIIDKNIYFENTMIKGTNLLFSSPNLNNEYFLYKDNKKYSLNNINIFKPIGITNLFGEFDNIKGIPTNYQNAIPKV